MSCYCVDAVLVSRVRCPVLPAEAATGCVGSPNVATTLAFASPPDSNRKCWPIFSRNGDGYVYIAPVA